jgi:hypothetical protein
MPGDWRPDADPMAEYLSYLADERASAVGDMAFTVEDFKRYFAGLSGNRTRCPLHVVAGDMTAGCVAKAREFHPM